MNYRTYLKTDGLSREKWLEARRHGIGGSDAGAIVGMNSHRSRLDVWADKTSKEPPEDHDNAFMRIGRDLEEYVAKRWEEETGKKCHKKNAILQSVDYPFMFANVDRLVAGENAGLEIKTASPYQSARWQNNKIPQEYEIQCNHYMAVTGCDRWYVCALVYPYIECRVVERDDELINNLIILEKQFWDNYIVTGEMPPADGTDSAQDVINNLYPESNPEEEVKCLDHLVDKVDRLNEINALMATLDQEEAAIKQSIQQEMKTAENAVICDYKVTWKSTKPRVSFDSKKLAEDDIALYEKYLKEGKSTRRFSIKKMNIENTEE